MSRGGLCGEKAILDTQWLAHAGPSILRPLHAVAPTADKPSMQWNHKNIQKMRTQIAEELGSLKGTGSKKIMSSILQEIHRLGDAASKEHDLRRFLFVLMALSHQSQAQLLKGEDIKRLVEIATGLLDVYGIRNEKSQLSWLRADLHQLVSHCYRALGQHDDALWEHFTSLYIEEANVREGDGYRKLILGCRLVRLGYVDSALEKFAAAKKQGIPVSSQSYLALMIAQCHFIKGSHASLEEHLANLNFKSLPEFAKIEFQWLLAVSKFQRNRSISTLLGMVKKGKPHHGEGYLLECVMLGFAFLPKEEQGQLPRVTYLKRAKDLKLHKQGPWAAAAEVIESLYDPSIPVLIRLHSLREAFLKRLSFLTIDKELLFIAAAYRWSRYANVTPVSEYLRCEYESLSLRISSGTTHNIWGALTPNDDDASCQSSEPAALSGF